MLSTKLIGLQGGEAAPAALPYWIRTSGITWTGNTYINDMCKDPDGNVYVVMYLTGRSNSDSDVSYVVTKINPSGNIEFESALTATSHYKSISYITNGTYAGYVLLTGYTVNPGISYFAMNTTTGDISTVYNGSAVNTYGYAGYQGTNDYFYFGSYTNNTVISGTYDIEILRCTSSSLSSGWSTTMFSGTTGNEQISGGCYNSFGSGSNIFCGLMRGGQHTVAAFSATSTLIWGKYHSSSHGVTSVTSDSSGNVYSLSGVNVPAYSPIVTKFDNDGNVVWSKSFTHNSALVAQARGGVAVDDATGDVYVSFISRHDVPSSTTSYQNFLFKLDSNGTVDWGRLFYSMYPSAGNTTSVNPVQVTDDGVYYGMRISTESQGAITAVLKYPKDGSIIGSGQELYVGNGTNTYEIVDAASVFTVADFTLWTTYTASTAARSRTINSTSYTSLLEKRKSYIKELTFV